MDRQDVAIMFSGGRDSLALYCLAMVGLHPEVPKARNIHILHMLNGMGRFPKFPKDRLEIAKEILERQVPVNEKAPETSYVELDVGRLFQGLWLNNYESLMPRFGGKNLVCVACKLAMHTRAILYCINNYVPVLLVGYAKRQSCYPEQTTVFMEKLADFSQSLGITTKYPVYEEFETEEIARHFLEDHGLPSTGGGERKCLFCQTLTTATENEIGDYLDYMLPRIERYVECMQGGRIKEAAKCFLSDKLSEIT